MTKKWYKMNNVNHQYEWDFLNITYKTKTVWTTIFWDRAGSKYRYGYKYRDGD